MALPEVVPLLPIFFFSLLLLKASNSSASCGYSSIISFGDSLADTGNFIISVGPKPSHVKNPPYGETYFHRPTGRFSDGRLVVDFIAQAMGFPLLPPYLGGTKSQNFSGGVNFAVGGATALDAAFFREKGIHIKDTNVSLGTQLEWFKQLLPSLCSSPSDCHDILSTSLFLVGEIGGNDYNHPFLAGTSLDEVLTFIPEVVKEIGSAIDVLIHHGAKTLVVPGDLPIGCIPGYLATFQSPNQEEYDPETGCIKWLNEFSEYHNGQLLDELHRARERHPHATIIYADYYNAALRIFRSPSQFGFSKGALIACCGAGGPYNYNSSVMCGNPGAKACYDPSNYVSWDGMHLTEAAYRAIADGILRSYTDPPLVDLLPCIATWADE